MNLYFSACDLVILPYKKASQSGILPIAYNYNKIVLINDITRNLIKYRSSQRIKLRSLPELPPLAMLDD